jgi:hypothetical protein
VDDVNWILPESIDWIKIKSHFVNSHIMYLGTILYYLRCMYMYFYLYWKQVFILWLVLHFWLRPVKFV